jgi:hypothetical protein
MAFETGGTFSPSQKNAAGSSVIGLIQFMSTTAKNLGTSTSELAKMTAVEQLNYVEKYLKQGEIKQFRGCLYGCIVSKGGWKRIRLCVI